MEKPNKTIENYKKLSEYWDTHNGTEGIEELEDIHIVTDNNIKSHILTRQEPLLYLQGFLNIKQVQRIKK